MFWTDSAGAAHVTETAAFVARAPAALWATQSGPLLVRNGDLHPAVAHDGPSRVIRNEVGVGENGDAEFVISVDPVSFGRPARLFRDRLGCTDALYLDGAVSSLWAPGLGRHDARADLGPLVVVIAKEQ